VAPLTGFGLPGGLTITYSADTFSIEGLGGFLTGSATFKATLACPTKCSTSAQIQFNFISIPCGPSLLDVTATQAPVGVVYVGLPWTLTVAKASVKNSSSLSFFFSLVEERLATTSPTNSLQKFFLPFT